MRLLINILLLNIMSFTAAKGVINTTDNNIPINIIMAIDIVKLVFP